MLTLQSMLSLSRQVVFKKDDEPFLIPLQKGCTLELYDRPGKWISDTGLSTLVRDIRAVYQESMDSEVAEYGVLKGDREDLKRRVIVLIRDSHQKPIAFCALARLEVRHGFLIEEVIHLGLVSIIPSWRKAGLQGALYTLPVAFLFFQGGLMRLYFTNVTQVPAIFGQCEDYFEHVYPSSKGNEKQGFHHFRIASSIYHQYKDIFGVGEDSVFVPELQIIQNSYTGGSDLLKKSFDQSAKHRRKEVNDFCATHLDYIRGDDFIQVGQMDYRAILRFLSARPDQKGLMRFALEGVTWSMQTLVVPLLQWIARG